MNTLEKSTVLKLPPVKLAAKASELRPIVRPRMMRAARAPVFTIVSVV
jgi:hypothetical protein